MTGISGLEAPCACGCGRWILFYAKDRQGRELRRPRSRSSPILFSNACAQRLRRANLRSQA